MAKTEKIKNMLIAHVTKKQQQEEEEEEQQLQQLDQATALQAVDEAQWFRAAKEGDLAVIQQGISDKMDVNCRDSGGRTALYWATFYGHVELVVYLSSQHADLSISSVSVLIF